CFRISWSSSAVTLVVLVSGNSHVYGWIPILASRAATHELWVEFPGRQSRHNDEVGNKESLFEYRHNTIDLPPSILVENGK
ncbi:hypothetical protein SODALDRAFT_374796, partial [Sodiomyces alkalinus F11]